ncbi:MAG: Fe3+-siderophores ABC transporter protein [Bdellovibrionaceae bacterium]|nr:Fe3+-siderophores ABC transporter protein [Pseudobdellovibrionaceae bacterium]|tara:strand:- start:40835 stop:41563 length:729 start_codon:yes stop_codon:yes gene_type:complete
MRVISLIPSITETLIECGVNVVARTRYCIHPSNKVKDIPIIGGTKAVQWDKAPQADLVILDKEENTKEMAASCPYPRFVIHITNLENLRNTLVDLSVELKNQKLLDLANKLETVLKKEVVEQKTLREFPGIIQANEEFFQAKSLSYLIWKKPFMKIGSNTFISDMIKALGYSSFFVFQESKYPELKTLDASKNQGYILSSEPYPFAKEYAEWSKSYPCALVDGESFSWYGIRSIEFLCKNRV